jgi:branched-chain amino acid transport system substrate-binding protein
MRQLGLRRQRGRERQLPGRARGAAQRRTVGARAGHAEGGAAGGFQAERRRRDPETGIKAAKAAIAEGLDGVVGPYNSGVGVETLPLYLDAGLVPIRLTSDASTNKLGFTLQPMTYQIAPVASEALTDWLGAHSVAIAYDPTQNYTVSVSKALKKSLEAAGVTVTAYERVQPGKKSYADVVAKLAATKPDVIYSAVYYPEGGLIAKEMLESKVKAQCVADYASYDTGFVETAGVKAAAACPVVGVPAPGDFAGSAPYVSDYRDEFGAEPGTWSPYTYDSLNFLADGVEEAGSTDAKKLTPVLDAVHGRKGWTGSITIDPHNGNRQPATVVIVKTDPAGVLQVDADWAKAVGAPYSG